MSVSDTGLTNAPSRPALMRNFFPRVTYRIKSFITIKIFCSLSTALDSRHKSSLFISKDFNL